MNPPCLESGRRYTWGLGVNTYELYKGRRVYLHNTQRWLDECDTAWHKTNATSCPMFRYLDEQTA